MRKTSVSSLHDTNNMTCKRASDIVTKNLLLYLLCVDKTHIFILLLVWFTAAAVASEKLKITWKTSLLLKESMIKTFLVSFVSAHPSQTPFWKSH